MAKLKKGHFSGLSNIFGEKGKNLVDVLNAKPDHADFDSLTAIADPATASAEDVATLLNSILAALKTPA